MNHPSHPTRGNNASKISMSMTCLKKLQDSTSKYRSTILRLIEERSTTRGQLKGYWRKYNCSKDSMKISSHQLLISNLSTCLLTISSLKLRIFSNNTVHKIWIRSLIISTMMISLFLTTMSSGSVKKAPTKKIQIRSKNSILSTTWNPSLRNSKIRKAASHQGTTYLTLITIKIRLQLKTEFLIYLITCPNKNFSPDQFYSLLCKIETLTSQKSTYLKERLLKLNPKLHNKNSKS